MSEAMTDFPLLEARNNITSFPLRIKSPPDAVAAETDAIVARKKMASIYFSMPSVNALSKWN